MLGRNKNIPLQIKVGPLVVLECQQIVVTFLAHQAAEHSSLVGFLVVEEGAGVPVSSATLVTFMGPVALFTHRPAAISSNISASASNPTTDSLSSGHPFGSVQALLAQAPRSVLARAKVSDQVVTVRKKHSAVHANVIASIHLVIAVGRGSHNSLGLPFCSLGPMDKLVIQKVLLPGETLAAGGADHPPILLQVRRPRGGWIVGVAAEMAPEGSEAGIMVATHRALVHFPVVIFILVIVSHPFASALGVLALAAAFLHAT